MWSFYKIKSPDTRGNIVWTGNGYEANIKKSMLTSTHNQTQGWCNWRFFSFSSDTVIVGKALGQQARPV